MNPSRYLQLYIPPYTYPEDLRSCLHFATCSGYSAPIKWKSTSASDIQPRPSSPTRCDANLQDDPPSPSPIGSGQKPESIQAYYPSPPSSTIPSLIPHVHDSHDELLLRYFVETVSHALVFTTRKEQNPINQLILPMAFSDKDDWGLFDIIISLSASHRTCTLSAISSDLSQFDGGVQALERTKRDRYGRAVINHARNLSCVMQEPNDRLACIDYAIATTMFLAWWSTVENRDASTWNLNFAATRDFVSRKLDSLVRSADSTAPSGPGRTSQVLLEWVLHCDTIAVVTATERGCFLDTHGPAVDTLLATFNRRPPSEVLWIGPNDGLLRILARTLALRRATAVTNDLEGLTQQVEIPESTQYHQHFLSTSCIGQRSSTDFEPNLLLEAISLENALRDGSFAYNTP